MSITRRTFLADQRVESSAVPIAIGKSEFVISVDRSDFVLADGQMSLELELSLDGGKTWGGSIAEDRRSWSLWFRVEIPLKPHVLRSGDVSTASTLRVVIPQPGNANRLYRVAVRSQREIATSVDVS